MKTDLHDLLEDAAPRPAVSLDVDRIKGRGRGLRRRRVAARATSALALAGLIGVAVGNAGGSDGPRIDTTDPAGETHATQPATTTVVRGAGSSDPQSAQPTTTTTASETGGGVPEAQSVVFGDPAGDTEKTNPFAPATARSPEPELDIVEGQMTAFEDALRFDVRVDDLTDAAPPGSDGGAYKVAFTLETGGATTGGRVVMQRYNGFEEIQIAIATENVVPCQECSVEFSSDRNTVSGVVPIEVIDRLLRANGHPGQGLRPGDRVFDPAVATQWVHTQNRSQETDGPYGASDADNASGRGRSITCP